MHRHSVTPLVLASALFLGGAGCHHKKTASADGGTDGSTPGGDGGTGGDAGMGGDAGVACGKLPPTGASQVVQPSTGTDELGRGVRVGVDKAGRPLLAYLDAPINGGLQTLYVQRWDDCAGAWRSAVKVDDTISSIGTGQTVFALSVDPTSGIVGIAYLKKATLATSAAPSQTVFVAQSTDDGATFASAKVSKHAVENGAGAGDLDDAGEPNIVLGGGKTYVAYVQNNTACPPSNSGCAEAVVLATGTVGTYTYAHMRDSTDASHGGDFAARAFTLGLALDSAGTPGIVAHQEPVSGSTVLAFWRPGQQNFVTITDSAGVQNDDGAAALAYDGLAPRVVSRLQQGMLSNSNIYDLVFSSSADGLGWSTVALPRPESIANSQSIQAHAGTVSIVAGGPHLFRSTNLIDFTVDGLALAQGSSSTGSSLTAAGKLWAVAEGITPPADVTGGVVFYREP